MLLVQEWVRENIGDEHMKSSSFIFTFKRMPIKAVYHLDNLLLKDLK